VETRRRITKAAASGLTLATLWQSSAFSYQTTYSLGLGTMDFGPKNGGFLRNVYNELPSILAQKRSFFAAGFNVRCEFVAG
jgi:hypothetical protein